jgi:hypothetical protein
MPINQETLSKYKYPNTLFIETGSHNGSTIQLAINIGFNRIISIELSEHYFKVCKHKFLNCGNVELILGDSSKVLDNILKNVHVSATFWLDGHYCGGGGDDTDYAPTAIGELKNPLMQELKVISKHHIKNHTILIDDMRLWHKNSEIEVDMINFDVEDIKSVILDINPNYKFYYENGHIPNDILVATTL